MFGLSKVFSVNRPQPPAGDSAMLRELSQIDSTFLKAAFDAAFMDSHLDSDGDVVVSTPLKVIVKAEPEKKILKLLTLFGVKTDRLKILEFCNRFNRDLIVCRTFVGDQRGNEGEWVVCFDYDRVVMPEERLDAKTIVLLVRRFTEIVTGGIRVSDSDNLF